MSKVQLVVSVLWLVLFVMACAPAPAPITTPAPAAPVARIPAAPPPAVPAKPAWEIEWNKTVQAAQKEGVVIVVTTSGPELSRPVGEAFKSRFGISIEWVAGTGSAVGVRVVNERRARIYSADTGLMGFSAPLEILKPAGALQGLAPALLLPELTDTEEIRKVWRFGKLEWVDKEHTVLVFGPQVDTPMVVNTQLVKPGEIKGYRDLLDPKWKGKIVMFDVTLGTGKGTGWVQAIGNNIMGWDYMRRLAEQDPIITRDARLQIEWLAHGKYAIAIAARDELVTEFVRIGAPVRALLPEEGVSISAGPGANILLNDAPHPNAAKLFINWLLTKEGQYLFGKARGSPSGRLDVTIEGLDPLLIPNPKMNYVSSYSEEALRDRPEATRKAKEIFGKLMK